MCVVKYWRLSLDLLTVDGTVAGGGGVAVGFNTANIMKAENALHQVRQGVVVEIGGDIANAQVGGGRCRRWVDGGGYPAASEG